MVCGLAALRLVLASAAGLAQDGELLGAPACRKAMDALQARESGAAADGNTAVSQLAALRRQAAVACLGGHGVPASQPQRHVPPPMVVRPVTVAPQRLPVPSALPPAPKPVETPLTLTACDATGCWTSDGTRLQRAGPNLLGPRGVCTVSGPFVQCPR